MSKDQQQQPQRYTLEEQHHLIGSQYDPNQPKPKKRKRVFMWTFLVIQALFVLWLITGISSVSSTPADCGTLDAKTCSDATAAGAGIGAMLILVLWCIVDFLMVIIWAVTRLARKR